MPKTMNDFENATIIDHSQEESKPDFLIITHDKTGEIPEDRSTVFGIEGECDIKNTQMKGIVEFEEQNEALVLIYESNQYQSVLKNIDDKIIALDIPERWKEEGIIPPSIECKKLAIKIAFNLFKEYEMLPNSVSPSKEEGIYLRYKNTHTLKGLSIEVDNESDVLALVDQYIRKTIIQSSVIQNCDFSEAHHLYATFQP